MLGKTLTHYTILDKIGSGGMGVVYRARDERLGREVALKVLPQAALGDEAARGRFRVEAMALSRLNHPNIATVHDFDAQEGVDFLVMEHVEGDTLARRLERGAIPLTETIALGIQIAAALEEAHERSVIHRDLKPGNVMIGPKGRVKVLDFGLAKLLQLGEAAETASISATGTWSGTLPYMPPEQLEGTTVDARSDLYAFGAILYEMATGRRAFPITNAARLLSAILNERPAPPSTVAPGLPAAFDALVGRLLEKDPAHRPRSAREAADALAGMAGSPSSGPARPAPSPAGRGAGIQSLVVLPLENLSGDPEQEFFADGMTEELIADLAQIQALRVISRTSAMRYKKTQKTLQEIGRELNVEAVVEGSVRRYGDRVRITAQLIEVASDRHLWAKSYERDLRDVLALQGEVAQAIAQEIQIKLTPQEEARLAKAQRVDPRAYEAYLKGRHHWNQRTDESLLRSLEYFREAIQLDPSWPTAHVGLADAYNVLGYFGTLAPADCFPKAKAAALAALQIDEGLAQAHAALAYTRHFHDWDWEAARQGFQRALQLNEGDAYIHLFHMNYLSSVGRHQEAMRAIDRAVELDPLSMIINTAVGWARFFAGDFQGAVSRLRRSAELYPEFMPARVWYSSALEQHGLLEEALAHAERGAAIAGRIPVALAALGRAHARLGRIDDAGAVVRELQELSKRRYVSPYDIAVVLEALGLPSEALDQLERAYAGRANFLALMKVDPRLKDLRGEPRFQELERRMAFP
jgi:serine/threonine protein kinase/tetratricopeptide (TPR) repeat protein